MTSAGSTSAGSAPGGYSNPKSPYGTSPFAIRSPYVRYSAMSVTARPLACHAIVAIDGCDDEDARRRERVARREPQRRHTTLAVSGATVSTASSAAGSTGRVRRGRKSASKTNGSTQGR